MLSLDSETYLPDTPSLYMPEGDQAVNGQNSFDEALQLLPESEGLARPFLKWAGGKRTLIRDIARLRPATIATYWEPFLGGGAVFFALEDCVTRAYLSDVNAELALTYQIVRNKPEQLIDVLQFHESRHEEKEYYYRVRKLTHSKDPVVVAARFIYLNKTCYNGLYRVNRKGEFNVPRGSYSNPLICDDDNLRKASRVLQKATIRYQDFSKIDPSDQDFVYCDPPYDGTFASYDAGGFGEKEQKCLRDAAVKWHKLGAAVMISNADTPFIRSLYSGDPFRLHEVSAPRPINCNGSGRGPTAELLITTYA